MTSPGEDLYVHEIRERFYNLERFYDGDIYKVLRRASAGESVGDINRKPTVFGTGVGNIASILQWLGYLDETQVGSRAVTPYVMQGGFDVSSEPIWRSAVTDKGRDLLARLEAQLTACEHDWRVDMRESPTGGFTHSLLEDEAPAPGALVQLSRLVSVDTRKIVCAECGATDMQRAPKPDAISDDPKDWPRA